MAGLSEDKDFHMKIVSEVDESTETMSCTAVEIGEDEGGIGIELSLASFLNEDVVRNSDTVGDEKEEEKQEASPASRSCEGSQGVDNEDEVEEASIVAVEEESIDNEPVVTGTTEESSKEKRKSFHLFAKKVKKKQSNKSREAIEQGAVVVPRRDTTESKEETVQTDENSPLPVRGEEGPTVSPESLREIMSEPETLVAKQNSDPVKISTSEHTQSTDKEDWIPTEVVIPSLREPDEAESEEVLSFVNTFSVMTALMEDTKQSEQERVSPEDTKNKLIAMSRTQILETIESGKSDPIILQGDMTLQDEKSSCSAKPVSSVAEGTGNEASSNENHGAEMSVACEMEATRADTTTPPPKPKEQDIVKEVKGQNDLMGEIVTSREAKLDEKHALGEVVKMVASFGGTVASMLALADEQEETSLHQLGTTNGIEEASEQPDQGHAAFKTPAKELVVSSENELATGSSESDDSFTERMDPQDDISEGKNLSTPLIVQETTSLQKEGVELSVTSMKSQDDASTSVLVSAPSSGDAFDMSTTVPGVDASATSSGKQEATDESTPYEQEGIEVPVTSVEHQDATFQSEDDSTPSTGREAMHESTPHVVDGEELPVASMEPQEEPLVGKEAMNESTPSDVGPEFPVTSMESQDDSSNSEDVSTLSVCKEVMDKSTRYEEDGVGVPVTSVEAQEDTPERVDICAPSAGKDAMHESTDEEEGVEFPITSLLKISDEDDMRNGASLKKNRKLNVPFQLFQKRVKERKTTESHEEGAGTAKASKDPPNHASSITPKANEEMVHHTSVGSRKPSKQAVDAKSNKKRLSARMSAISSKSWFKNRKAARSMPKSKSADERNAHGEDSTLLTMEEGSFSSTDGSEEVPVKERDDHPVTTFLFSFDGSRLVETPMNDDEREDDMEWTTLRFDERVAETTTDDQDRGIWLDPLESVVKTQMLALCNKIEATGSCVATNTASCVGDTRMSALCNKNEATGACDAENTASFDDIGACGDAQTIAVATCFQKYDEMVSFGCTESDGDDKTSVNECKAIFEADLYISDDENSLILSLSDEDSLFQSLDEVSV
jgi:hypothetical protein